MSRKIQPTYEHTKIQVDGVEFDLEDIKKGHVHKHDLSDFEKNCFQFIADWFSKKDTFQLTTSGSTGKPKTISVQRQQLTASALSTIDFFKLNQQHTAFVCIPLQYIGGKMMLVRAFLVNMKVVIVSPEANPILYHALPADSFVALVPYQMSAILKNADSKQKLANAHAVILGGAAVPHELSTEIGTLSIPVYSTFGMTETISHIALKRLNGANKNSHFEAMKGVQLSVDSESRLIIHAKEITGQETLLTNDVVELHSPTSFEWKGRFDNVINSGGIKIYTEELERQIEVIFKSKGFDFSFFIHPMEDANLGQVPALVLETESIPDGLPQLLKSSLAKFHYPKHIFASRKFEYTANGKLLRAASYKKVDR